jgi:hypothetical protein
MINEIKNLISQIPSNIIPYLSGMCIIFLIALSIVYIFGRMLGLAKKNSSRNLIAILFMIPSSFITMFMLKYQSFIDISKITLIQLIWFTCDSLFVFFLAIILYVLIGFHLYEWFDNFVEKKFFKKDNKKEKKNDD